MTQATQNQTMKETDPYWEAFERFEEEIKHPTWLFPIRKAGIARFAELGFPTLKDEDWRFTNVAPIARLPFKPVLEHVGAQLEAAALKRFSFANFKASRLVFVDGHFSEELSSILPQAEGVKVGNLAAALQSDPAILEKHLARYVQSEGNAFTALNTAFFQDGAFIYVPAGKTVEEPVHLLFVSTSLEAGATTMPRNLIIAEKGSKLTVIESFVSTENGPYFTNAVDELVIGENAVVEHCKFQDESMEAYHIAAMHVYLGRNCNFIAHSITTGARLSRNNIRTSLADEGVECILNGLYLTRDDQVADNHMIVDHAKPHCNSHEYYNGILDGRSKGVFHGRILVRPDAQKTDAKQTNKNLLLSDDATIDTKPQLEIYADDVKCTHGATIGQLNEESIFYLRARGIGADKARQMLIHAFAGEIIDRIRFAPAREEMDKIVWDRLEQNPLVGEKK
jgi:Fe-S cluster assembly protein SufD